MAVVSRTDTEELVPKLEERLRQAYPDAQELRVLDADIPADSGLSNDTIRFTAEYMEGGEQRVESLVARVQPEGEGVFQYYDLGSEYRIMEALAKTVVPVPRVVFYEDDPAVLGTPFLVMEFVEGRVPPDDPSYTREGWVLDLSPEERSRMCDNGLKTLADVHAVDWQDLGLGYLARPELGATPLEQQLTFYERSQAWGSEGVHNPVVEATLDWLQAHRPAEPEPTVLSWGDAKLGNMLFSDDLSVNAALDFEMASLASPELDLGWWLFLLRWHTEGVGVEELPQGIFDRETAIERYEHHSGHSVQNATYYETLGGLRLAVIVERAARMMIAAGVLPSDHPAPHNNQATIPLARMLDLPAPVGPSLRDFR